MYLRRFYVDILNAIDKKKCMKNRQNKTMCTSKQAKTTLDIFKKISGQFPALFVATKKAKT